ncbi:MAG TPA: DsrE family protein [Usitatibacter sp.]|nr:DsrE family protein [Usitatibacter sp.]
MHFDQETAKRRAQTGATALAAVALGLGFVAHSAHAAGAPAGAQPSKSEYGVIFQIDRGDQATIKKTLNNIENILHDPRFKGRTLQVELIANSKGFEVYAKGNGFESKLKQLKADGVKLAQCANTLRELHVDRNDLYSFVRIVPSGMGEIVIRQGEGWAYIHPSSPPANQL